ESHMGGVIAAPTAGKLIEDVLNYLQVERRYTEEDLKSIAKEVLVPEVRNMTVEEAVKSLKQQGLAYKLEGNGNNKSMVLEQIPKPDASIPQNSVVLLYTYKPEKQPTVKMPDLLKKSISEATEALKNAGLNIRVSGSGIAVKQEYAPGMSVPKGEVIEVDFKQLDNMEVEVWED
ncbi:MAG: PASTA domain-containing protein, partial [Ruminiclostridium sp.]|nr:PASTA domain-containing protein [Ruminiclostridium sp.]